MRTFIDLLIRVLAGLLVLLSLSVSVPLTIRTWAEGGGPWGFGIVSLPLLLPLSGYMLFGVAGLVRQPVQQREMFLGAHIITVVTGLITFAFFPAYPVVLLSIPLFLAVASVIARRHYRFFLFLMIMAAVAANIVLLKWEFDFGRTIPLLQLLLMSHTGAFAFLAQSVGGGRISGGAVGGAVNGSSSGCISGALCGHTSGEGSLAGMPSGGGWGTGTSSGGSGS